MERKKHGGTVRRDEGLNESNVERAERLQREARDWSRAISYERRVS